MIELFRDTYCYRELIWALALKELKIRYKRSFLGFLWALLNPLLQMTVLAVVFSTVMRIPIPHFAVFLISALIPWTFFSQSLLYAADSIVNNSDLIKKVRVPKTIFPVAALVSNLINFGLSMIPLFIIVVALGNRIHLTWLYLPVPILALTMLTLGASFFVAALNVYYRDVAHILTILLQLWFYITPILYPIAMFGQYQWLFKLNPVYFALGGFRMAVYEGALPSLNSIILSFVCGTIALVVGYAVFRKNQEQFVYYV
ncbi:MAG TPA: ABC transporter permease [Bryobacteraceae bacterium]|jgi:ABC-type polysaccharide/polyol phosphate export permease|nr:ABC transporter permease [Bryobacteraceae bacterium]